MDVLFATSNPHKLREVGEILKPGGIAVRSLDSLGRQFPEPDEDALTFEENARIKAREYAAATGLLCLAEDSGLEVDALSGAPGVHSARYAGAEGSREQRDQRNNEKLLRELTGVSADQRGARFVCAMALCRPDGTVLAEARGTYEGIISESPRGENGFGYDPLLFLPELGRTSAELTSEEKHARSHRGQATRQLAALLEQLEV